MDIQGLGLSNGYIPAASVSGKPATQKAAEEAAAAEEKKGVDGFAKSETTTTVTYSPPKKLTEDERKTIDDQRAAAFHKMLLGMLGRQGEAYNFVARGLDQTAGGANASKAAASIAPGGEYSVDAVATRILDMAKSLAGGDASKIGMLRDAVEKGFKAAGAELGGRLPSISRDTHTEVMKRFDEWEDEAASE